MEQNGSPRPRQSSGETLLPAMGPIYHRFEVQLRRVPPLSFRKNQPANPQRLLQYHPVPTVDRAESLGPRLVALRESGAPLRIGSVPLS